MTRQTKTRASKPLFAWHWTRKSSSLTWSKY